MKKRHSREESAVEHLRSEVSKSLRVRQIVFNRAQSRMVDLPRRQPGLIRLLASVYGFQTRPRNGKVARLPEATRNQINHMLEDGFPYRTILAKLRESSAVLPYPISEMNISNWFRGGYQDWRRQQQDNALASENRADAPKLTAPMGTFPQPPEPVKG